MFNNSTDVYTRRREFIFLLLSGVFLGSLSLLNVLGISRFLDLSFSIGSVRVPFTFAVGVIAYPITFLCTDLISEIYGRRRANMVVWVGLVLNIWVVFVMWIGGMFPPNDHLINDVATGYTNMPPLPTMENYATSDWAFFRMRQLTFGAVTASMIAYLTAQFVDVQVFHFLKRLTKGKHLWVRNNFSTLASQLVDSVAVILITHFYAKALPIDAEKSLLSQLIIYILSGYVFKLVAAITDTVPFYFGTKMLRSYLHIEDELK
ncbi:MAG: queuosine precursor transporter [Okeania sp. SIO3C4]|nr:queuosine precursor transporter [Okeania sp. SIO3C4]